MFCTQCGSELPDGLTHCRVCGAPVRPPRPFAAPPPEEEADSACGAEQGTDPPTPQRPADAPLAYPPLRNTFAPSDALSESEAFRPESAVSQPGPYNPAGPNAPAGSGYAVYQNDPAELGAAGYHNRPAYLGGPMRGNSAAGGEPGGPAERNPLASPGEQDGSANQANQNSLAGPGRPAYRPGPAYQIGSAYQTGSAYRPSPDAPQDPVGMGEWLLACLAAAVPVLNIVMLCVWGFGGNTKPSKRSWARAQLIVLVGMSMLGVLLAVLVIAFLAAGIMPLYDPFY